MNFTMVIISVMALLTVFSLVGLGVTFNAYRTAHRERVAREGRLDGEGGGGTPNAERALRERIRRYVGPVDPKTALLNPPARVAVEFVGAFCGFPGLGWLCSGSVFTGLLLICCVPAFTWGFYPVILAVTDKLATSPYIVIEYLPGVAIGSAGMLAYREIMLARRRRRGEAEEAGHAD